MFNLFQFILLARKKCRCGYCRKYTLDKLTKCLVKNKIYFGPCGCIEEEYNTKTRLCKECIIKTKKNKNLVKTFRGD